MAYFQAPIEVDPRTRYSWLVSLYIISMLMLSLKKEKEKEQIPFFVFVVGSHFAF
jgi:hypothetical protein